jgi:hypothetical protein
MLAGIAALGELMGTLGDSDETFVEYFADSGNRTRDAIGGLFLTGGAIAFIVFLVSTEPLVSPADGLLSARASWALGLVLAGLLLVAASAASASSLSRIYAEAFDEGAGLSEGTAAGVLPQLATVLLMTASLLAAAWIAVTSIAGLDSSTLPRAVCFIGFGAAILLILLTAGVPLVPFPLWLLLAALTLRQPDVSPPD